MAIPRFFELEQYKLGDFEVDVCEAGDYNHGPAITCPRCGVPISMLTWLPPYRVVLELIGRQFGDLAFIGGRSVFLVSERFCSMYHEARLSGLTGFEPVEVTRVKSRRRKCPEPPPYFRVEPKLTEAVLDIKASGCEWIDPPTCEFCLTGQLIRRKRLVLKEGSWTGEDIFLARGAPGSIIVTERLKIACEQFGITNAILVPAELAGIDFYPETRTRGLDGRS